VPHARHRVVAVGRNTHGELGLGYTSHEATWGLVSPGFDGEGGVRAVHAGGSSSWIVTKTHAAELGECEGRVMLCAGPDGCCSAQQPLCVWQ
jgi:hypothetical protein